MNHVNTFFLLTSVIVSSSIFAMEQNSESKTLTIINKSTDPVHLSYRPHILGATGIIQYKGEMLINPQQSITTDFPLLVPIIVVLSGYCPQPTSYFRVKTDEPLIITEDRNNNIMFTQQSESPWITPIINDGSDTSSDEGCFFIQ